MNPDSDVARYGILVNRKSTVPLNRQLEAALRDAIVSGRLPAGERILSSRELQTHLGLSRNTVLDALAQLHAEGYLVTERGIGTFVASHVNQWPPHSVELDAGAEFVPSESAQRHLGAQALAANVHGMVPFRPGMPALDLFPAALFKRCFDTSEWTPELLDYADPFGHMPLRVAIARRLQQTRGVVCDPEQIAIAAGAQAAFSLICNVLLDDGDAAVVEDPGYPNVRATLLAHGARVEPAPVDDGGIVVESFANLSAKLAYVTPSHQYPLGPVLSLERRFALIEWAAKNGAWVVEDDYDSEFNYTSRPQPALQGLAGGTRVIYVGTFSKVLSPAVRVAYVVFPRSLRSAFEAAQRVTGGSPDTIVQAALARFIARGHFGRHITKMRKVYDERRRFVASALERDAGSFRVRDTLAGLHFIAELPDAIRDSDVSERLAARGIIVPALSSYFTGTPVRNGLVIGFACTPIPQAKRAIEELRRAVAPS